MVCITKLGSFLVPLNGLRYGESVSVNSCDKGAISAIFWNCWLLTIFVGIVKNPYHNNITKYVASVTKTSQIKSQMNFTVYGYNKKHSYSYHFDNVNVNGIESVS